MEVSSSLPLAKGSYLSLLFLVFTNGPCNSEPAVQFKALYVDLSDCLLQAEWLTCFEEFA